jgi:hypothetical protein
MGISGKFLGPTKGNTDRNTNVSQGGGGSGESHGGSPSGKFLGSTKGNTNIPPNRTSGVSGGHGGRSADVTAPGA